MLRQPKNTKYRKKFRKALKRITSKSPCLKFGTFGLQALESGFVSAKIIESSRQFLARYLKRGSKIWICIFPDHPVTSKPSEVRMGKGKGAVDFWAAKVRRGSILFEVTGPNSSLILKSLKSLAFKLPISVSIIQKSLF